MEKQTLQTHAECETQEGIIWDITGRIIILETTVQKRMGFQAE